MQIVAKTFDERKFTVDIDSLEDTVGSVKAKLEAIEGTPMDQQSLVFDYKRLEDDENTLAHYGIQNDSVINYKLKIQNNHRLYVKTLDRRSLTLEVQSLQTINDIKCMIEKELAISVSNQSLLFKGRRIDDYGEHFLIAVNIYNGATLNLSTEFVL